MITQTRQALSNRKTPLHVSTSGQGPPLVLLHGWGLHSAVWDRVLPELEESYHVIRIDLPGHGLSDPIVDLSDLQTLTALLRRLTPSRARVVGWSLGGLVALSYALRYPGNTQRLVLVASTPRFVSARGWEHAAAPEVFDEFSSTLERDYRATLNRFLALQVRSAEGAHDALRGLRKILFERPPKPSALRSGLELLRSTDLRKQLRYLECPTRLIVGEQDALVPKDSAQATVKRLKNGAFHIIRGAGHAPFLSHPPEFTAILRKFLSDEC